MTSPPFSLAKRHCNGIGAYPQTASAVNTTRSANLRVKAIETEKLPVSSRASAFLRQFASR
jgi:hypothetical protein